MLLRDPLVEGYVEEIGRKVIAGQPSLEHVEFRFRVLRDPMVNAFALPNGTVYVTTGLLATLENEAQLAGVLGHESTHVLNRHSYRENRSARKKAVALNIMQGVAASMPAGSAFGAAIALGATVGASIVQYTVFGYSQEKEREADRYGFDLMTKASYDPNAMAQTFALLDERLKFEPVEGFYRTHPKLEERRKTPSSTPRPLACPTPAWAPKQITWLMSRAQFATTSKPNSTAAARALASPKPSAWSNGIPPNPAPGAIWRRIPRPGRQVRRAQRGRQGRHGQAEHRKQYFQMTQQEEQTRLLARGNGLPLTTPIFATLRSRISKPCA